MITDIFGDFHQVSVEKMVFFLETNATAIVVIR
jgi:hypothetical protein